MMCVTRKMTWDELAKENAELKAENKELKELTKWFNAYVNLNIPEDYKDFDPLVIIDRINKVLNEGKGHNGEWKTLSRFDHLYKCHRHLDGWLNSMGDEVEDHLGHALVRVCMAILKGE